MVLRERDMDLLGSLYASELSEDWEQASAVLPMVELAVMAGIPLDEVPASLRRLIAAGMLRSYLRDEALDELDGFVALRMTPAGHALVTGVRG